MKVNENQMQIDSSTKILLEDILYIKGDANYSRIVTNNCRQYIVALTLSKMEQRLPGFIRCHKQVLVNPAYIQRITHTHDLNGPMILTLTTGDRLMVSRRRAQKTRQAIAAHDKLIRQTSGSLVSDTVAFQ